MTPQRHWDTRAAANFAFGGAGSGLLVLSAFHASQAEVLLGLALVGAGLGAVWLEIGRKLRAMHVFFNPFTSWMSREAFCAVLLFGCGLAVLLGGAKLLVHATALLAAAFLYCQARILFAAKGIPAWRVPQIVPLVIFAGLAEGAALALLFGASPAFVAVLILARHWAWRRYAARAARPELAVPGKALALGGGAALVLAALAPLIPSAIPVVAPLAALAVLAPGWWLKHALVTRASYKQPFTLPHLPVRGAR